MHLRLDNHKARVEQIEDPEVSWLSRYLTIERDDFQFDPVTKRAVYKGKKYEYLYDHGDGSFLAGFLPMVYRGALKHGFKVTVDDTRTVPACRDVTADVRWLRDYQAAALDAIFARRRGLVQAPTGSGKTEIIVGFLRSLPETPTLVLVHRAQLMRDIKARADLRADEHGLERLDIGLYGDEQHELGHRITLATFQTIAAHIADPRVRLMLRSIQALVVDEAHTLAAESFMRVVERLPNAYYRLGVSGTPLDRSDRRSNLTLGLIGPVVHKIPTQLLIERGVLARPRVHLVRYDADEIPSALWAHVRKEGIVESEPRNRAVVGAVERGDKPLLVFVDQLAHGRFLQEVIEQGLRLRSEFVFGAKDTRARERAAKGLARGELDVVVCSDVWKEGVDIPAVAGVVLAAGGKSTIGVLQRIGRGMRCAPGKTTFQIWDFEDRTNRILEDHMLARKRAYKREGHEVVVDTGQLSLDMARINDRALARRRARRVS